MDEPAVFDHLVLAGGPPRSGTTLLARMLSVHPQLALRGDNPTFESWSLYRYADYSGLVDELRNARVNTRTAARWLFQDIVQDGRIGNIAPSPFLSSNTLAVGASPLHGMPRFQLPLAAFGPDFRLCLKSPEISFILPELGSAFPQARFVLVYRPVIETAESMYRKGHQWANAYHRRWNTERDAAGSRIPPVDTPDDLAVHWNEATDFQRCAIRATAFLRAMVEGARLLPEDRVHVYYHPDLRREPTRALTALAGFLGVSAAGFSIAERLVKPDEPNLPENLLREFEDIATILRLEPTLRTARQLSARDATTTIEGLPC